MALFSVRLMRRRQIIEQAEVEVEAAIEAEAIEQAKENDDIEWTAIDQETGEPTCSAVPL